MQKAALVTGGAGFIGSHVAERLLHRGYRVFCLDSFEGDYSPVVKWRNVSGLSNHPHFVLVKGSILNRGLLHSLFSSQPLQLVVHLAALTGVRPSVEQPERYMEVNLRGTITLLEVARGFPIERFVFASSSSVYGGHGQVPFVEGQDLRPLSPYAVSKAAAELSCYAYNHLYGLPIVCLRFFTVYGPRQRPDLAICKFVKQIEGGEEVTVFGDGTSQRDYTYISDLVDGIEGAINYGGNGFDVFNLGTSQPVALIPLIEIIEGALGKTASLKRLPPHPADPPATSADISKAQRVLGYRPNVGIEEGIARFVQWYRQEARRRIVTPALVSVP